MIDGYSVSIQHACWISNCVFVFQIQCINIFYKYDAFAALLIIITKLYEINSSITVIIIQWFWICQSYFERYVSETFINCYSTRRGVINTILLNSPLVSSATSISNNFSWTIREPSLRIRSDNDLDDNLSFTRQLVIHKKKYRIRDAVYMYTVVFVRFIYMLSKIADLSNFTSLTRITRKSLIVLFYRLHYALH